MLEARERAGKCKETMRDLKKRTWEEVRRGTAEDGNK